MIYLTFVIHRGQCNENMLGDSIWSLIKESSDDVN